MKIIISTLAITLASFSHADYKDTSNIKIELVNDVKWNIEYMSYFDTVGVEVAGFTLGLSKSF